VRTVGRRRKWNEWKKGNGRNSKRPYDVLTSSGEDPQGDRFAGEQ
jgi:hypothetical protein